MKFKHLTLFVMTLLLVAVTASSSFADISAAAVNFLRIAAGARAAGMGEAFVAVADDATATHWNPAGLGAYPLADTWLERSLPYEYLPLKDFAVMRKGKGGNFLSFDIWAITGKGLARYDNKKWYTGEVFDTKTDDKLSQIVASYLNIGDDDVLKTVVHRVALANNKRDYDWLVEFTDKITQAIPEDYKDKEGIQKNIDSLLTCYDECRLDWEKIYEAEDRFKDGIKDSVLNNEEAERVNFALEKSKNRFIPEEIFIPYMVIFDGDIKRIISNGDLLLVVTEDAVVTHTGKFWQTYGADKGLTSTNVLSLGTVGRDILIGTDNGIFSINAVSSNAEPLGAGLPEGPVTAIGGYNFNDIYAVVNQDLYHYDGTNWGNNFVYQVTLEDTPEKLAERFSVYGTSQDKKLYIDKFNKLNPGFKMPQAPVIEETSEETQQTDSSKAATTDPAQLKPASEIHIPYLAEFKGHVNAIEASIYRKIFFGTDQGIIVLDLNKWTWEMPGYKTYTVQPGQTFEDIVNLRRFKTEAQSESYTAALKSINDLGDSPALTEGQTLKVYSNPAANDTRSITSHEQDVFFVTPGGLLEYDGVIWSRSGIMGLGKDNVIAAQSNVDEMWILTNDRMVIQARGRTEITLMHVKWLKEFASDMYYEFMSFVNAHDWGTIGGNVTFLTYGSIPITQNNPDELGSIEAYDFAITLSYGTSITSRLKGGVSAKIIYSHLSDVGAGSEQGKGTSTGFAVDVGLLYHMTPRLNWGLAITNLGPKMAYIDAAQADDLPRNLAFGFAYKLIQTDYNQLLVTGEINKLLIGLDDGFSEEIKQTIFSGGAEFVYANLISARAGAYYDEEGQVTTITLGFGLHLLETFKFDFAYIPVQYNTDGVLENTLRISLSVLP